MSSFAPGVDYSFGLESPAKKLVAITPSDTTELVTVVRGIYVGTGGTLIVLAIEDSATVTLTNVPAGSLIPIVAKRVHATGTTAANLVGFI